MITSDSNALLLPGGLYMNEGYLIVKCLYCGSQCQVPLKGVRNEISLCPVCREGEIECKAIQPSINIFQELYAGISGLSPYVASFLGLSAN